MKKRRGPARKKIEGIYDSKLELCLHKYWIENYEETMTPQHKFHPIRAWRFDFAFPSYMIAIEIQGHGTGHTSYEGMRRDYEKHNEAMKLGWGLMYIMSVDLQPHTISKTCSYIELILNTKRGIHEREVSRSVRKDDRRGFNPLDEARRKLFEGFD